MAEESGEEESEDDSVTITAGPPRHDPMTTPLSRRLSFQVRSLGGAVTCFRVPRATTVRVRGDCGILFSLSSL